jgi:DNA-binding MarR family transcriptional regulator
MGKSMVAQHLVEQVVAALRRIIRANDLRSRQLAQRCGLTAPQVSVLGGLSRSGSMLAGRLARQVSLSHATVTDILHRMEARGLVVRSRDQLDRRRVMVGPTTDGLALIAKVPTVLAEHFTDQLGQLADWEQTQLLSSLQRVATMMEEMPPAAPAVGDDSLSHTTTL